MSDLSHQTPRGAVIGGWERERPTYVARVQHKGGHWELGKLNFWAKYGYSYYGKEYESKEGEVLVAIDGQVVCWKQVFYCFQFRHLQEICLQPICWHMHLWNTYHPHQGGLRQMFLRNASRRNNWARFLSMQSYHFLPSPTAFCCPRNRQFSIQKPLV